MGKRNRDVQQKLREIIREAVRTAHNLPPTGTRPRSWGSTMPDYVREVSESYGYDSARIGRITPDNGAIDRLDAVCAAMASNELRPLDRELLWAVGQRTPWKLITGRHGFSREWGWKLHDRALITFGIVLASTAKVREAA